MSRYRSLFLLFLSGILGMAEGEVLFLNSEALAGLHNEQGIFAWGAGIMRQRNSQHPSASLNESQLKPISNAPRARLTGHRRDIVLQFNRTGDILATGGDDSIARLWDVAAAKLKYELTTHSFVSLLTFSPDGRTIATGDHGRTIKLWDVRAGRLETTLEGESDWIGSAAFSPDGRTLATASYQDFFVQMWDVETGRLKGTLEHQKPYRYAGGVEDVAFTPDGKTLVTSCSRIVYLWDIATRQVRTTLVDESVRLWEGFRSRKGFSHGDTIYRIAISPDGRTLATASRDNTAKLWDLQAGKLRATLKHKHKVIQLAFNGDSNLLATGSEDKTARLWDVTTGNAKAVLKHRGTVWSIDFSPNGRLIATAADNDHSVKIWNAANGELLDELKEARYPVAFSPDGRTLATGGEKGLVLLWDVLAR